MNRLPVGQALHNAAHSHQQAALASHMCRGRLASCNARAHTEPHRQSSVAPAAAQTRRHTVHLPPCAAAGNEFRNFAQCCVQSFGRSPNIPLRGDGLTSFECYLSDSGSLSPRCWMNPRDGSGSCVMGTTFYPCDPGERLSVLGWAVALITGRQ